LRRLSGTGHRSASARRGAPYGFRGGTNGCEQQFPPHVTLSEAARTGPWGSAPWAGVAAAGPRLDYSPTLAWPLRIVMHFWDNLGNIE